MLVVISWTQQQEIKPYNGGIFQLEVETKNIGRIKYRDGQVMISQNQQKNTDFFFTPFPYVDSDETVCNEDELNDRIELVLHVELYTPQLVQDVKEYLMKRQAIVCGNMTSDFWCDVSMLPMHSIRLVQKDSNSAGTRQKYRLDDRWQSAALRPQSMKFVIYTPNMTTCENLRKTLTEKCRLLDFEIHSSLNGQENVKRELEVTMEHVTSTTMFNRIRTQFPSVATVLLTGGDFKELLSESSNRVTMTLRLQEGFENMQDPMDIGKQLELHLSTQKIQLQLINDRLWENLYWTEELTRPDRLAKVLNTIVQKAAGANEDFIYNRQAAKNAIKFNLTQHDKHQLQQFDKQFDSKRQTSSPSGLRISTNQSTNGFLFDLTDNSSNTEEHTNKIDSDSQHTVVERQHGDASDSDVLNKREEDKQSLDINSSVRGDLNSTQTDKEQFTVIQMNTNDFDKVDIHTNDLNPTKVDKNMKMQYTLSRQIVIQFLNRLSDNIYLHDDLIKPRPINAHLVKIDKMTTNTKLFSSTVLIRMRSNINVLPLRCKPKEHGNKSKIWLTDRVDQLEKILLDLKNQMNITKLQTEQMSADFKQQEKKTEQMSADFKQEVRHVSNNINVRIDSLYLNLTGIINQTVETPRIKKFPSTPGISINISQNARWAQNGITVAGGHEKGEGTNQLYHPFGLYVDENQTIYIADSGNNRIVQWKSNATSGQMVAGGNGQEYDLDQLDRPTDVIVDKETNSLIICDYGNRRVMKWSLQSNAEEGEILLENIDCYGLTMDDQRYLYVSDYYKYEVRRYQIGEKYGTLVAGGNGEGDRLNQLNGPADLFVDREYSVYVSETNNHRVMKWVKGATEGIVVAGGQGKGNSLNQLSHPLGVFVDLLGTVYVAEESNHRVTRWRKGVTQGEVIVGGNGQGEEANQFNRPEGLSFDQHGHLYVVDVRNNRVQRFSLETN